MQSCCEVGDWAHKGPSGVSAAYWVPPPGLTQPLPPDGSAPWTTPATRLDNTVLGSHDASWLVQQKLPLERVLSSSWLLICPGCRSCQQLDSRRGQGRVHSGQGEAPCLMLSGLGVRVQAGSDSRSTSRGLLAIAAGDTGPLPTAGSSDKTATPLSKSPELEEIEKGTITPGI